MLEIYHDIDLDKLVVVHVFGLKRENDNGAGYALILHTNVFLII